MSLIIRPIEPQDNPQIEQVVLSVLTEFGCVGPGFASSDPELKRMYETYQESDSAYWVVYDTESKQALGGSGFARLKETTPEQAICELQKLYFSPVLRGKGFGRKLMELCIAEAARAGYREMYLETVHQMKSAVGLYEKFGFAPLPTYKGDTGHRGCTVFMSRPLRESDTVRPMALESVESLVST